MPTINDATVVASAYQTSASARPQYLSNGWIVVAEYDTTGKIIYLQVDKRNGSGFVPLCNINPGGFDASSFSLASIGTNVYVLYKCNETASGSSNVRWVHFDALTVTNTNKNTTVNMLDQISSPINPIQGLNWTLNEAKTEIHAVWSCKTPTYPNSFNIRYAKGTINADGSVTWGAVEQRTSVNTSGWDYKNPTISIKSDGYPIIIADALLNGIYYIKRLRNSAGTWSEGDVYNGGSYVQSSPSAIFVPQSVNGLANGRIWVAWHGLDSTDTSANNIRISYSDDGGATWSAMQKVTTGNTYHQNQVTITANKNNKIFLLWRGFDSTSATNAQLRKSEFVASWSAPVNLTAYTSNININPSTLFDLSVNFTEPLVIYMEPSSVRFRGTWTITTISVPQGSIGTKSDRTSLLTYSITTDGTMSTVTEKVNGVTVDTKNPTSGQSTTVSLDQAEWDAIKYGKYANTSAGLNTLEITMGTEKWTYTFDKRLATGDDVLSAVKATQDAQTTFIPAVKSKLASAITSKGGSATGADSWDTLVSAVGGIPLGKKWASGTVTSSSSTVTFYNQNGTGISSYYVIVSGLSFTPSVIMITDTTTTPVGSYRTSINTSVPQHQGFSMITRDGTWVRLTSPAYISSTGFELPVSNQSVTCNWIAFE